MNDLPTANKSAVKNDFLVVPSSPVSGGDSIPVGIQINAASLTRLAKGVPAKELVITKASIALFWENKAIAVFELPGAMFDHINKGQEIHIATRIKVKPKPETKPPSGTLRASVNVAMQNDPKLPLKTETATIAIEESNSAPVSIGQLVLSLQPTTSQNLAMVAVKAIVPKPQATGRALHEIGGVTRDLSPGATGTPLITMTIQDPDMLSDEVFFGFNFVPSNLPILEMSWVYDKNDKEKNLTATARLPG